MFISLLWFSFLSFMAENNFSESPVGFDSKTSSKSVVSQTGRLCSSSRSFTSFTRGTPWFLSSWKYRHAAVTVRQLSNSLWSQHLLISPPVQLLDRRSDKKKVGMVAAHKGRKVANKDSCQQRPQPVRATQCVFGNC